MVLNNPVSFACLETIIGGLWLYLEADGSTHESDNASVALLGPYACAYKEISCAPRSMLIKRTPTRK